MTSKSYIVCPDGHFSEGDTCTTCGYKPGEVISDVVINNINDEEIYNVGSGQEAA